MLLESKGHAICQKWRYADTLKRVCSVDVWSAHRRNAKPSPLQQWGLRIHKTRGHNKATVALANKLARTVWAVWKRGSQYQADRKAA